MKKLAILLILLLVLGLLIGAVGCGGGGEEPTGTPMPTPARGPRGEPPSTYKYTTVRLMDGQTSTYKAWVKDGKSRMEITTSEAGGEESTDIYISSDGYDYHYDPEENEATKSPSSYGYGVNPALRFVPFMDEFDKYYTIYDSDAAIFAEMENECAADRECLNVEPVGHETIAGFNCALFEETSKEETSKVGTKTKVWLSLDKGWVVKLEMTTAELTATIESKEIDLNPTIPDSVFDLPAGVEIIEFPS